uniref:Zinc finger protein OZF-like n=1 Tax=Xenopus tropicalis TaxID=8364 RepID=F7AX10_XENTR
PGAPKSLRPRQVPLLPTPSSGPGFLSHTHYNDQSRNILDDPRTSTNTSGMITQDTSMSFNATDLSSLESGNHPSIIQNTIAQKVQFLKGSKHNVGDITMPKQKGRPFKCNECGKQFLFVEKLRLHQNTHTKKKSYACRKCKKSFSSRLLLFTHKKVHKQERPHVCSECNKGFQKRSLLVRHQRTHTGVKLFSCNECGKRFSQRSNVTRHYRIHTGERPHICSECGKCFGQLSCLKTHRRTHTKEKPHVCAECGKCYSDRSDWFRHVKTHTGEKPYPCPDCGAGFIRRASLDRHRRVHTGEKPFACTICAKCFPYRSTLRLHQRTHTKERPYTCTECAKCFAQRSALNAHQRTHTKEKPYQCTECVAGGMAHAAQAISANSGRLVAHEQGDLSQAVCQSPKLSAEKFDSQVTLQPKKNIHVKVGGSSLHCQFWCLPAQLNMLNLQKPKASYTQAYVYVTCTEFVFYCTDVQVLIDLSNLMEHALFFCVPYFC